VGEGAALRTDFSYPLRVAAAKFPDRLALVFGDTGFSYADLDAATDRLASALHERGLGGKRVVVLLLNEPETIMVFLALARIGAINIPVNTRLNLAEKEFIVENSGAHAIIADAEFAADAEELRRRQPAVETLIVANAPLDLEDGEPLERLLAFNGPAVAVDIDPAAVATIIYTSGTSGFPKGVVRSHESNLWACVNAALGQPRSPDDIELFALPAFGIAFFLQLMPTLLAGGTVVLDRVFDPTRTWKLLEQHRATRVFLAPTMIASMLGVDGHEEYDVSTLHTLNTAYEFPERIRVRAAERFGDIFVYMYGLTEAQLCCSAAGEFAHDPTSAGQPMGLMRVKVVDEERRSLPSGVVGEIAFDGPSLMVGYYDLPVATAEALDAGWLYTGDFGYLDDDQRLHFSGRKKEIIKTGGFSVDPVEIENVILQVPDVLEAAVVGVPDEFWGEAIVAFVVTHDGSELEADITAYVRDRVADFKRPKEYRFIAELPKNATGKIERARLRALGTPSR
jgi:fatty-acyl-CoA synthase